MLNTAPNFVRMFADRAARIGLPRDAGERFVSAGYVPFPRQLDFHLACREADEPNGPLMIGFGGARGPGKTHAGFCQCAIDDAQRAPELSILFLRKVKRAAVESLESLRRQTLRHVPHDFSSSTFKFPNGSRIVAGHFQYDKDIDDYLSLQYDVIFIEQAEQLTRQKIVDIGTVNRNARADFRPRMYLSWNWGGVGHSYLKNTFYAPWLKGEEDETRFIRGLPSDNPALNDEYKKKLDELTGWKRKAWLHGDPNVLAGQFFEAFNENDHVINLAKEFPWIEDKKTGAKRIPQNARLWGSMDYGFTHYTVFYLFAALDGITYVMAEHAERKWLTASHADAIKQMLARFHLKPSDLQKIVAGPDTFARGRDKDGLTVAQQYAEHGIELHPATADRLAGASQFLRMLGSDEQEIEPTLRISSECVKLIECVPALEHDPKRPADVLKWDTDEDGQGGDDAYDAARYGLMEQPSAGLWIF